MPSLNESIISRKQLRGLFGKRSATAVPTVAEDAVADAVQPAAGGEYWRSLNELAQTPEFEDMLKREFSAVAADVIEPTTRRSFLKYMGASLALAGIGITSCRWPAEKIAPFANKQEGYRHGVPVQFATALDIGGVATGVLATSYDGRPIKLEGNPLHSGSLGAANSFHQASLLDLYDANRAKAVRRRTEPGSDGSAASWTDFTAVFAGVFGSHRQQQGSRMAVLCEAHSSPTRRRLQDELAASMPLAQWYEYEPLSWDSVRDGTRLAFGQALRPHYQLAQATVIASFDCDFLEGHPDSLRLARDWAKGRRGTGGRMNRVYQIEPGFSVTGAKADHRLQIKPSGVDSALYALAAELNSSLNLGLPGALSRGGGASFINAGAAQAWSALARDIAANPTSSVVIAGPECSAESQALACALNFALGNTGHTITYTTEEQGLRQTHAAALRDLTSRMDQGAIDTLLILGGNPVYDAPADIDFGEALAKVRHSIHLSLHDNETSRACGWLLPRAHFLEEWGDARGYDGSYSIIQPLIEPLYGGASPIELLSMVLEGNMIKGYDQVRKTFAPLAGASDFEASWREVLHDGVLQDSASPTATPSGVRSGQMRAPGPARPGEFELHFMHDYAVYDGRFANNGWLQETPNPLTKLTWDNACLMNPEDARELGVNDEDVVELKVGSRTAQLPVYVLPGQPRGVVSAGLGYGRTAAGDIGNGVGTNLYPLRDSSHSGWAAVELRPTGKVHELAGTQDHHVMDMRGFVERGKRVATIVREANLDFYNAHPEFPKHMVHTPGDVDRWIPLTTAPDGREPLHRWAMSIDLSTCTGCSACIVACTAENNIPVVGKQRVRQGREMHWLRIDRYFRQDPKDPRRTPDNPRVAQIPMTCQQCELAPCEQVCPVNATTHSDEGLNDMVYNRCIGTRYCSNNCPFKVRRFNFFNYQKSLTETQKLVHNPEVTIRSRGVMEKCTYCVQRIQTHKIAAKVEKRELQDGEIKTACQQTCSTEAITFGDLNNLESQVFDLRNEHRSYTLLDELQLRPRTNYLAGLWNPAPGTEEAEFPEPVQHAHHGAHEDGLSEHGADEHGDHPGDAGHAADHAHEEEAAHAGH